MEASLGVTVFHGRLNQPSKKDLTEVAETIACPYSAILDGRGVAGIHFLRNAQTR